MISINYETTKRLAFEKSKGYWRAQAKKQIDRKIAQGHPDLVKDILSLHKSKEDKALFIKRIQCGKRIDQQSSRNKAHSGTRNQTISNVFMTSAFFKSHHTTNNDRMIFRSDEEQKIFNQIEIFPFIVKKARSPSFKHVLLSLNQIKQVKHKACIVPQEKRVLRISNSVLLTQSYHLSKSYSQLPQHKTKRSASLIDNNGFFKSKAS